MKLGRSVAPACAMAGVKGCDFVAIGEGGIDVVCRSPAFPVPDRKQTLRDLRRLPGGQAATAAVGCARLGWQSRWVGSIGDDPSGEDLAAALRRDGVDVCAVVRTGVATRTAVVIVADDTEGRTVLERRDPRLDIRPTELAPASCAGRVLLVDATDLALAREAATLGRSAGGRVIIDLDRRPADADDVERVHGLLALIDVVIVPASFVTAFTGQSSLGAGLAEMGRALPEAAAVVATMGAEGALAWCRGVEVPVRPCPVEVVDTTGAGDAFRAGFAHAWLQSAGADPELEQLLGVASRVAALNCRAIGAQDGLPTRAELGSL